MVSLVIDNHGATMKYVIRGGGTEIRFGGGAGMRGYEAADYPRKASTCEGQELGGS